MTLERYDLGGHNVLHDLGGLNNVLHDLGDVCKRLNLPCDLITIILIVLMYVTGN